MTRECIWNNKYIDFDVLKTKLDVNLVILNLIEKNYKKDIYLWWDKQAKRYCVSFLTVCQDGSAFLSFKSSHREISSFRIETFYLLLINCLFLIKQEAESFWMRWHDTWQAALRVFPKETSWHLTLSLSPWYPHSQNKPRKFANTTLCKKENNNKNRQTEKKHQQTEKAP